MAMPGPGLQRPSSIRSLLYGQINRKYFLWLARRFRYQVDGPSRVVGIARFFPRLLFFQGPLPGDVDFQPALNQRADNAAPGPWRLRCNQEQAPPLAKLAEVIAVAGITPQAGIDDLAATRRIGPAKAMSMILISRWGLLSGYSDRTSTGMVTPVAPQYFTHDNRDMAGLPLCPTMMTGGLYNLQ
jgi:hypothetical protein